MEETLAETNRRNAVDLVRGLGGLVVPAAWCQLVLWPCLPVSLSCECVCVCAHAPVHPRGPTCPASGPAGPQKPQQSPFPVTSRALVCSRGLLMPKVQCALC